MTPEEKELCLGIALDQGIINAYSNVAKGCEIKDCDYSCYREILLAQWQDMKNAGKSCLKSMHLPEPWNGHLSKAEILFVGSNPNLDPNEDFPTCEWDKDEIASFFDGRFEEGKCIGSPYWRRAAETVSWVREDLEMCRKDFLDGVVFTEAVHCKSRREAGVQACLEHSMRKWLPPILKCFPGRVIVLAGEKTWHLKKRIQELQGSVKDLQGREFKILQICHPSAYGRGMTKKLKRSRVKAEAEALGDACVDREMCHSVKAPSNGFCIEIEGKSKCVFRDWRRPDNGGVGIEAQKQSGGWVIKVVTNGLDRSRFCEVLVKLSKGILIRGGNWHDDDPIEKRMKPGDVAKSAKIYNVDMRSDAMARELENAYHEIDELVRKALD